GVEERVKLDFRFIPDDEIAAVFAASEVVVAPYRREAQSGVALTAFHFGRPVVATEVGGLPEIIEDGANGFLVPPGDPETLAAVLDRFFEGDLWGPLSKGARSSAAHYSWERYARVLEVAVGGAARETAAKGE
ncbi:MAG: glycosyltransferase, partial [Thermoanaerobaculia bacterium]|nr:glycosyltransferase [Thermoanaerobaculia bacterium]